MLKLNARKYPETVCLMDKDRSYTFPQSNQRACRLAHGLMSLGLKKGDKVSCLLENCIEFVEIYLACAKAGIVVNPINFRVSQKDALYIANHAEAKAFIAHDIFTDTVDGIRKDLKVPQDRFVVVGKEKDGYIPYETLIEKGDSSEPEVELKPSDTWILLYTSGTTGRPKGC